MGGMGIECALWGEAWGGGAVVVVVLVVLVASLLCVVCCMVYAVYLITRADICCDLRVGHAMISLPVYSTIQYNTYNGIIINEFAALMRCHAMDVPYTVNLSMHPRTPLRTISY